MAVLDTIDPGGFYAARIRLFGPFAAASTSFKPDRMPWVFAEGIEDPLYGNVGGEAEQAALWGTLRKLRLACAGLAQFLHQLQDRCAPDCRRTACQLSLIACLAIRQGISSGNFFELLLDDLCALVCCLTDAQTDSTVASTVALLSCWKFVEHANIMEGESSCW